MIGTDLVVIEEPSVGRKYEDIVNDMEKYISYILDLPSAPENRIELKHMVNFFILYFVLLFISSLILVIEKVYKKHQEEDDDEWNITVHVGAGKARNRLGEK